MPEDVSTLFKYASNGDQGESDAKTAFLWDALEVVTKQYYCHFALGYVNELLLILPK